MLSFLADNTQITFFKTILSIFISLIIGFQHKNHMDTLTMLSIMYLDPEM